MKLLDVVHVEILSLGLIWEGQPVFLIDYFIILIIVILWRRSFW